MYAIVALVASATFAEKQPVKRGILSGYGGYGIGIDGGVPVSYTHLDVYKRQVDRYCK